MVPENVFKNGPCGGKWIGPDPDKAKKVIAIQHGLPGWNWRIGIEEKARELVESTDDIAVVLAITSGIRREARYLGLADDGDLDRIARFWPDLFGPDFSVSRFMCEFAGISNSIRKAISDRSDLHLVGQSYGGSALLKALKILVPPASADFLVPFVSTSIDDPRYPLHIHGPGLPGSSLDTPAKTILGEVLSGTERDYGASGLFEQHCRFFSTRFWQFLAGLDQKLEGMPTRVTLAGRDNYIGREHAEVISRITGKPLDEILKTAGFESDSHNVESWHPGMVLEG